MAIRITGLNSGLDTDSIVQELVSAHRLKTEKYQKAQTKLEWTQDTWKEMNTKIYGFYSKTLSNLRYGTNIGKQKTTKVSDDTKATVSADASVVNGTQTLKINKLATAGYLTGAKLELKNGEKLTAETTLGALGVKNGELTIKVGDEEKAVTVSADMTIEKFTEALKEQGITASFDKGQQRFFLSSSDSGAENDFEFVANGTEDLLLLKQLGLATTEQMMQEVTDKDMNEYLQFMTMEKAGVTAGVTYEAYLEMSEEEKAENWSQWETDFSAKTDDEKATAEKEAKVAIAQSFDVGLNVDESKYEDESYVEERIEALKEEYYKNLVASDKYKEEKLKYATKTDASDAEIELNGAVFTSDSNEFSINGLKITATGVSDLMTITTSTDVDKIYDTIKDFIGEYNTLVNAMESAYNADSAKGYEPLTDDEKSEMSEEEVEKWEKKIKDSLLRRDDTIGSILSSMSMSMSSVIEIDGKKYSLSSFGINTNSYFSRVENESYSYHIDGNKDDDATATNEDKLRKAIEENPEAVGEFFKELATKVYETLDQRMKTSELSSAYTVYNDKQMKEEYDDYTDTIKKWEEKLKDLEDYYYKQFSAMETALAELNSQTNSLASLLGG